MRARFLLLAAALVAFGASLGSGFHFDDYAIFSGSVIRYPLLYHAFNLALHLGAVLLAYECLRRLASERAAWIAAGLFAVHPLQAEAVNYVSALRVLLIAVVCLASLLAWIGRRRWLAVALVPATLWVALGATRRVATTATPSSHIFAQGVVIWRYLRLLVVPWGFTIDPDISVPPVWLGAVAWLALLGAAALLWRLRSRRAAAWFLAGLGLLVGISLFPARDLAADYRTYLPMFAFAGAAGILLERVKAREVSIALIGVLLALSVGRTYVWLSDERLWREAVRRAPEKVRPKIQLAKVVRAAEALELLARARQLDPHDPEIPAETGRVFLDERQPEAALAEFSSALALDPRNALYLNNRGVALAELGQSEAARMDFEQALAIDPNFAEARENLNKLAGR